MNIGRILAVAAALTLGAAPTLAREGPAQAYQWAPAPFGGGGFVSGFVFHPREKGLLYARTDVGGCYRWDPATSRWMALNDGLGREDNQLAGALSLALDANDANRVYVAAGEYTADWARTGALLRSTDRGADWEIIDLPFKLGGNQDGRSTGERLQVDPNLGSTLFLGSSKDGLWRSGDFGKTWSKVASLPVASPSLVLFDPAGGQPGKASSVIYAGAISPHGPGLYVSKDAGTSWAPEPGAPTGLTPHHAAFDAAGTLYVTFGDGPGPNDVKAGAVWKRAPSGAWSEITPVKPSPNQPFGYAGLGVDSQHPGVLVVSTLDRWNPGDEVYRSVDAGAHWTALSPVSRQDASDAPWLSAYSAGRVAMGHWIGALAIDPFDSGDALYGTGYGLWRTGDLTKADSNQPVTWSFAVKGLEETVPLGLVSPPEGPHLLAALGDVGGLAYDDFVASPRSGFFLPNNQTNHSIAVAALNPLRMARTADQAPSGGFQSLDGGQTWAPFASTPRVERGSGGRYHNSGRIAVSAKGGFMVWGPEHQGGYASRDGGRSWRASAGWPDAGDQTLIPVADPLIEGVFYVSDPTRGEIHISVDGGRTFQLVAKGLPQWGGELRLAPGRLRDFWLPTPQGLFHSADLDHPFRNLKWVNEAYAMGFGKAAPGHDYPAVFLWGRVQGVVGLFRSDDEGETWVRINDARHQFGWLSSLTGDPGVFGRVYLATSGRGVMVGDLASAPPKEAP